MVRSGSIYIIEKIDLRACPQSNNQHTRLPSAKRASVLCPTDSLVSIKPKRSEQIVREALMDMRLTATYDLKPHFPIARISFKRSLIFSFFFFLFFFHSRLAVRQCVSYPIRCLYVLQGLKLAYQQIDQNLIFRRRKTLEIVWVSGDPHRKLVRLHELKVFFLHTIQRSFFP